MTAPDREEIGLYVHWPFCAAKCPYCDFNSHVRHSAIEQQDYLNGYLNELEVWRQKLIRANQSLPEIKTLFFGGGTPSLMQPILVESIIDELSQNWSLRPDAEITLEANPASSDAGHFAAYRQAGVNRLSIGVQSLVEKDLKALGRLHSVDEALRAIAIAKSHFERVSFDLIYARPEQSLDQWQSELIKALEYSTGHLSLYQLTIEPNTPYDALYRRGKLKMPREELARDFYILTDEICNAQGLPAYEISNYACPGDECRHNMVYWHYQPYLGIGPGAHGRVVLNDRLYSTLTSAHPETWLKEVNEEGHNGLQMEEIAHRDQLIEKILMGMRLREGMNFKALAAEYGFSPAPRLINELMADGLLQKTGEKPDQISATLEGRLLLNNIIAQLIDSLAETSPPQTVCLE